MALLATHLRNKMLAGALALTPVVIVIVAALWVEQQTQPIAHLLGLPSFPGLGVLILVAAVYGAGIVVTSLVGGFFVRVIDHWLQRIPGLNLLYRTWKDVLLTPKGKSSVYERVVLVPSRDGGLQIGFTSGVLLPGEPPRCCVFVPALPNPLSGQLILFPYAVCTPLNVSVQEAFKFLLSSGNYLPPALAPRETS